MSPLNSTVMICVTSDTVGQFFWTVRWRDKTSLIDISRLFISEIYELSSC